MQPPLPGTNPHAVDYRGRHRGLAASGRNRLTAAILLLAALALGTTAIQLTPDFEDRVRPFVRTGKVGEAVDVREFSVTVLGIRGGTRLKNASTLSETIYQTDGVWLLVKVRVRAFKGSTNFRGAALASADGRVYDASMRPSTTSNVQGRTLQPGIPVEGEIVFEVPKDVARDVTLQIAIEVGARLDAQAEVRMKTDASTVRSWTESTQPISIAPVVVVQP
jgi:hypothetical protein